MSNAFQRSDMDQDVFDFMEYCGMVTSEGLLSDDEMDAKAEEYQGVKQACRVWRLNRKS